MFHLLIILLFFLPAILVWRKEKRLRKLTYTRYQLTLSVTEMERLMLFGDIKIGDLSHDILFKHMQRVQYSDVYEVNWNVLKSPDRKVIELEKKLTKELSEDGCKFSGITRKFAGSYFRAFRLKHPYKSFFYILYLQLINGGVKCLMVSLLCMLFVFKFVEKIKSKQQKIFEESSINFFSHSEAVWIKSR